ncbi:patatin-like phospholipase family protein [Subtercola endophyticus]|uniref:patatin-like phospholipase family protein n=1 Tax=Subtercola endophyticus TaxID=2895559 RepID=UPI001E2AC55B|nr:patatin-like phospholipase family protein [Subtercola endophyticus]UFS60557.1 patatin-like phospholipase family protein [Subtercola endophyticus]
MNSTPITPLHVSDGRALVLGGGGAAGNAWLIGVIAGLFDGQLDVTDAELIIGTSAGATAAAQITAATPPQLYADILAAVPPQRPGGGRPASLHGPQGSMVDHLSRTNDVIAAADGPMDVRRRLAASALQLSDALDPARWARWRATVASRLPSPQWPAQSLLVTAVDAHTGDPVEFDRGSGVDLVDAVAASTSGGAPYGIGDGLYLDGGYRRSSENADLAAGYWRVLVLSPFGGRTRMPLEWNMHLAPQIDELREGGSDVETIFPDGAALAAFGDSMMDLSTRLPAARAGYALGRARAAKLTEFWR